VNGFRQLAAEQNSTIQMMLPMAEIVGLLQQGIGYLLREAGLALMRLVMEGEVRHLAGERDEQRESRKAHRWGKEGGYCVVDGQKVPIQRTRLRTKHNREQRLGSYELFQRYGALEQGVWDKIMRGLSTRNYGAVVRDFSKAYGIEKSAVSENFIEAGREKVKQLMERSLGELRLCALVIDATPFKDGQIVVALGIGCNGCKTVLGLREGATENATVLLPIFFAKLGARNMLVGRMPEILRAEKRVGRHHTRFSHCCRTPALKARQLKQIRPRMFRLNSPELRKAG
jgi:putative transposase